MPDITPTELEAAGLRSIGRDLGAGLREGLSDVFQLLSLSSKKKDEPKADEVEDAKEAEPDKTEKTEGEASEDEKPTEAGYDDLDKSVNTEGAIDVSYFVASVRDGMEALAKSVDAVLAGQSAHGAEIAAVRAELETARAENAALKTMIGASHLALAKLGESIVDPLMKSITDRPAGVSAGVSATSPGAAAARLGHDTPALVPYTDEHLNKAVELGVLDPNLAVHYKFHRVFSKDAAVDASIRQTLNQTSLKA